MQVEFKQIQMKPVKYNAKGDLVHEEYATLTVNIRMDTKEQNEAVMELLKLLNREVIYMDVYGTRQVEG